MPHPIDELLREQEAARAATIARLRAVAAGSTAQQKVGGLAPEPAPEAKES